jgi:hypothetical protein
MGASGTTERTNTAPLPSEEVSDDPMAFIATILANTLVPTGRDQGDVCSF